MPCGSSKESANQDENGHCAFEDLDHSVLQQPLNLGVTNVKQILKCVQSGSKEIKDIILNECNIIYECKACDGLFRSLANFMYHKRCYCKKHLCEDMLLFEKFEEEIVVVNPEAPTENSEKTDHFPEISKLADCTVDLVKSNVPAKMETADKDKSDAQNTAKGKNPANGADKGKAKSVPEKTESSMISRRTRNKIAQPAVKVITAEEPPIKCAKLISARIMRKDTNEKTNTAKKEGQHLTTSIKDGKTKKITISKHPEVKSKNEPSFPKVVFKAIDSNPHAVYVSSDKKRLGSFCATSNTAIKSKADKDKLIIVLKKDAKSESLSPSKSPQKNKNEMERLSEFHLTRRKRLMSRNDCNVHELRCLTCKTQFMSLKTLYFHMLSLHSKKRLYYPCPFCKTLFVQMYGVSRHLISIHNKTKEQINKMRDMIKKKSVWKRIEDVNPATDSKVSPLNYQLQSQPQVEVKETTLPKPVESASPELSTDPDSPKAVIRLGKNVTLHPCGKCGRVFGRKSSQVSHEKFCIMNNTVKKECADDPPPAEAPVTVASPRAPVVSFLAMPQAQKQSPSKPACVLQISKPDNSPVNKPAVEMPLSLSNVKLSNRPKRGAEKQMHKDFVNSQTLKWRSANRVDTSVTNKATVPLKKVSGKNLEKKVHSFMNVDDLSCSKCNKKFSSYSNLRRHVAIHVGWTRFKCKYCDYQAYNKSQCWAHVQKSHPVEADEMEKCIVHLPNSSPPKKASQNYTSIGTKRSSNESAKSNALSKVKISKKKTANVFKNAGSEKKIQPQKQELDLQNDEPDLENNEDQEEIQTVVPVLKVAKKDVSEVKKEKPRATITITKLCHKDNPDKDKPQAMITIQKFPKKEAVDGKKEKTQHIIPLQKLTVPDYKKDTSYKTVTTSNPTTIILSKKISSPTVQPIVTISPESMSSTKVSQTRSSPRKAETKCTEEKLITTLVTRSPGNKKITPIQIKLQGRSSSIEDSPEDTNAQNYPKKEKLVSEWFPKKDFSSNTMRRDSAPLIIGLVPASHSGVNAQTKNSANAPEVEKIDS